MDSYSVVFRGKVLSGFDEADVVRNLMALFKADEARIRALLKQPKVVLKAGISREAGSKYQDALRQAGIMVAVVSDAPGGESATATAAPPAATPPQSGLSVADPGALLSAHQPAPKVEIDTSKLSLDVVGAQVDQRQKPVASARYDLSKFSLGAIGDTIVEKTAVAVPQIDTSNLSLEPAKPEVAERSNDFWKQAERG